MPHASHGICRIDLIYILVRWHRRHLNQGFRFVFLGSLCVCEYFVY